MGMPITVEIVDQVSETVFKSVFDYFKKIDSQFSTYKTASEISKINDGLPKNQWSPLMREILKLCEQTKRQTNGYFDIQHTGKLDPSGLVKGWAIREAAQRLKRHGLKNFYIEAGGDIQASGMNESKKPWCVGIRSPFNIDEIIKSISVSSEGVATSGTYIRGQHIYNPHEPEQQVKDVVSLTVIGPDVYEADRFATAAFAMGRDGINFIGSLPSLEAYMVTSDHQATFTDGFERYAQ